MTRRRKPTSGTTLTVVCPIHAMPSNPVFRIHWVAGRSPRIEGANVEDLGYGLWHTYVGRCHETHCRTTVQRRATKIGRIMEALTPTGRRRAAAEVMTAGEFEEMLREPDEALAVILWRRRSAR